MTMTPINNEETTNSILVAALRINEVRGNRQFVSVKTSNGMDMKSPFGKF